MKKLHTPFFSICPHFFNNQTQTKTSKKTIFGRRENQGKVKPRKPKTHQQLVNPSENKKYFSILILPSKDFFEKNNEKKWGKKEKGEYTS